VAGRFRCFTQSAAETPEAFILAARPGGVDLMAHWQEVPETPGNKPPFRQCWETFLRHVGEDAPYLPTLVEGAKAVQLADLAYRDPNLEVRSQLASSARRLPAAQALPIVKSLAQRSEDVDDIHIPLLIWWAIESKADNDREAVLALFSDKAFWDQPLVSKHLSERLMRRYAATGQRKDLLTAAKLLACDFAFVLRCDAKTFSRSAVATPQGLLADVGPSDTPIDPTVHFPSRAIV
jgi:hypothetical protein